MKSLMQSKLDFFMGLFSFFLNQAIGIIFLFLVFQKIPNLNGWQFYELVFIYGFAQIPRGIDHFFTDYLWVFCRRTIREGSFDRYLLRPINPLFQVVVERCQPDGLGEILVGLLLVITAAQNLGIEMSFLAVLAFILAVIAGSIIFTSIKLFFATNAFFIKDAYSLLFLAYNLSDFAKYPLNIYSGFIRVVLSYIIPFSFAAFIPASFFLNDVSIISTIGAGLLVAIIAFFIAYRYFVFGIKHYESAGN